MIKLYYNKPLRAENLGEPDYKFGVFDYSRDLAYKTWTFPGGEVGFKLDITPKINDWLCTASRPCINFVARITNSNDFFELAQAKNAIEEYCIGKGIRVPKLNLILPYVPYGQQDRVCDKGEAFSLKVFADLIRSLNFKNIVYADPHSTVMKGVLGGAAVSRFEIIDQNQILRTQLGAGMPVSPDAGANKQTADIAKYFNKERFIRADKLRNLSTGEIIETIVYGDVPETVVILDDICVGGRTFIELAKALKAKGAKKVILYVTHFVGPTAGHLYEFIDHIYTTNSYRTTPPERALENKFTMVDIEPLLLSKIP